MDKTTFNVAEALPQKGRAFSLRTNFNLSLIDSFKYLIEVCSDVVSLESFLAAKKTLESLKAEAQLSGYLSAMHLNLVQALEQEDIQEIKVLVDELGTNNYVVEKLAYTNYSDLSDRRLNNILKIFSRELLEEISLVPLSHEGYEEMKTATQKGFFVLKRSFPDFFQEAQDLISEILFLNGNRWRNGSSCDMFGVIYLGFLHKWKTVTDILGFLIHEQSHLYVYLVNNKDALVLNPSERHESPLRTEKRPLMGIYHATFVLTRMIHVLREALKLGEIPEEEKSYCQELLDYYQKRAQVGFDILEKNAQMTALGKNLISSGCKLAA